MEFNPRTSTKVHACCCVPGCTSRAAKHRTLSFHRLPKAGNYVINIHGCSVDRRQEWLKVLQIDHAKPHVVICSLHFSENSYHFPDVNTARRYLKRSAIPTINLPSAEVKNLLQAMGKTANLKPEPTIDLIPYTVNLNGKKIYKVYYWCIVPKCKSTSMKTPDKIFFRVPKNKSLRLLWLKAAKRDPVKMSKVSAIFICEDHFDLANDMENYMQYKLNGGLKKIKDHVIPHIFNSHEPSESSEYDPGIQSTSQTQTNDNSKSQLELNTTFANNFEFITIKTEPLDETMDVEEILTIEQKETNIKIKEL